MRSLMRASKLAEVLISNGKTARSSPLRRAFVTPAKPLQGENKEGEQLQNVKEVKEAANAVKEGAKQFQETTEYVREMASSTADSVKKMTKDVTEKVSKAADTVTEKTMGTASGAWDSAKAASDMVKDKFSGN